VVGGPGEDQPARGSTQSSKWAFKEKEEEHTNFLERGEEEHNGFDIDVICSDANDVNNSEVEGRWRLAYQI
jgi:hypothetical protein